MKNNQRQTQPAPKGLVHPDYPFSGQQLYGDVRLLLSEEYGRTLSIESFGQLIRIKKNKTYYICQNALHTNVRALFSWLELLSPERRHAYFVKHSRVLPRLDDPCLAHAPAKTGKLLSLMEMQSGLTFLVGGSAWMRAFVLTALGHACQRGEASRKLIAGIDLQPCGRYVPLQPLLYPEQAMEDGQLRRLVVEALPGVLTSTASVLLFNKVWFCVPELQEALVRCAHKKHIIIADVGTPDIGKLQRNITAPLHVVTLSPSKRVSGCIRINCRRIKTRNCQQN